LLSAPVSPARRVETTRKETDMAARDLMTPDPISVTLQATVAEVWDVMREQDIRHVPVVDRGALVGMVSDRDLARIDMGRLLAVHGAEALQAELSMPIAKVMSASVIAVEPETEVADVVELLLEHKVGALPVVQGDSRELVGIISYIDVLRVVRDLLDETGEEE
jgi:CBS domain-containing protein